MGRRIWLRTLLPTYHCLVSEAPVLTCVLPRLCGVMLHMHEHDDDHAINHIAD